MCAVTEPPQNPTVASVGFTATIRTPTRWARTDGVSSIPGPMSWHMIRATPGGPPGGVEVAAGSSEGEAANDPPEGEAATGVEATPVESWAQLPPRNRASPPTANQYFRVATPDSFERAPERTAPVPAPRVWHRRFQGSACRRAPRSVDTPAYALPRRLESPVASRTRRTG